MAQTLNDLSGGTSYAPASVDLRARTLAALDHHRAHGWLDDLDDLDEREGLKLGESTTSGRSC